MHTRAFEPYRNYAPLDRIIAEKAEQSFIWDFVDATQTGILKVTNTDYSEEISGLKEALITSELTTMVDITSSLISFLLQSLIFCFLILIANQK